MNLDAVQAATSNFRFSEALSDKNFRVKQAATLPPRPQYFSAHHYELNISIDSQKLKKFILHASLTAT